MTHHHSPDSHDPLDLLTTLRPDPAALEARWPSAARDQTLEEILGSRGRPHRGRYVFGAAGIAAAAAVVAALVHAGPAGGPDPSTSPPMKDAAVTVALNRLVLVAQTRTVTIGDGRYWHLVERGYETGGNSPDSTTTQESWTDRDGTVWRHDTEVSDGRTADRYFRFPAGSDNVNGPTPAYLDSLPTRPAALYDFLEAHVQGSNSHEEAMFVAVGDMLRGGFAPPALRSAAIEVLNRLPHVSLSGRTRDSQGRTVEQFDFVDESIRPDEVQSISFDPRTAEILDEGFTAPDTTAGAAVITADTVDSVPADVLAKAIPQHG